MVFDGDWSSMVGLLFFLLFFLPYLTTVSLSRLLFSNHTLSSNHSRPPLADLSSVICALIVYTLSQDPNDPGDAGTNVVCVL